MGILDGNVIVVTGGGSGVGWGHCIHLAKAGAKVVVNDVNVDGSQNTADEIRAAGGVSIVNNSDIGSREGVQALVDQCVDEFGRIDGYINNAGIVRDRTVLNMSDEEFGDVIRIHVWGTFWGCQIAGRQMRKQGEGGILINTTSTAHWGHFGQTNYSGAKGAIASMTYTMAAELVRYGIRVNCISPAGTTGMSTRRDEPDFQPGGQHYMDPSKNGAMVVFLCSDQANYITGQIFGTEGDTVSLLSQPHYSIVMDNPGGWDVEGLVERFGKVIGNKLEPFTLYKPPYPYYDGIKPGKPNAQN